MGRIHTAVVDEVKAYAPQDLAKVKIMGGGTHFTADLTGTSH